MMAKRTAKMVETKRDAVSKNNQFFSLQGPCNSTQRRAEIGVCVPGDTLPPLLAEPLIAFFVAQKSWPSNRA